MLDLSVLENQDSILNEFKEYDHCQLMLLHSEKREKDGTTRQILHCKTAH